MRTTPKIILSCALIASITTLPAAASERGRDRREPVNVARAVGLAQVTRSWSVNIVDSNRDGDQDLLLVRHNPQWFWFGTAPAPTATMYRNTGRAFAEGTSSFGRFDRHDCDFGDVDKDGDPDLFCAIGLSDRSRNRLWRHTGSGWKDASRAFHLRGPDALPGNGNYRTVTFLHANGDRYPDVYVTRYPGPDGPPLNDPAESPPGPNELLVNVRGDHFKRAPWRGLDRGIGAQKDTPGCTQAVDFDRDGRQDLLVCGYGGLHLYRNGRSRFWDVTDRFGLGGRWKDASIARLDHDRRRDLVLVREGLVEIRYFRRGKWHVRARRNITGGEGVATGDFNGDGRSDVYVLRSCTSGGDLGDQLLVNRGGGDFRARAIPGVDKGCGNTVEAIDYNGDGDTDFVVLNGKQKTAGPVQLYTWR